MNLWFKISKKNPIGRKSIALVRQFPRALKRMTAKSEDYNSLPPIIADSFPKSGTHLLTQILEMFPRVTNYGSFLASMPSVTFRERPQYIHKKLIRLVVPGELLSAHLFYDPIYHLELSKQNCVHFFIYRDPRDVVVSEVYYLTFANRWHRLHAYFRALGSNEERIMFSILGASDKSFPYDYPNVARRFQRYEGWMEQENVFTIKFEDLVSQDRVRFIRKMIKFYKSYSDNDVNEDELVIRALNNINPKNSHTFRKGRSGTWREAFSDEHKDQMKAVAGDLIVRLGYEKDLDW